MKQFNAIRGCSGIAQPPPLQLTADEPPAFLSEGAPHTLNQKQPSRALCGQAHAARGCYLFPGPGGRLLRLPPSSFLPRTPHPSSHPHPLFAFTPAAPLGVLPPAFRRSCTPEIKRGKMRFHNRAIYIARGREAASPRCVHTNPRVPAADGGHTRGAAWHDPTPTRSHGADSTEPVCSQPLPARDHQPCLSALPTPPGHTRGDGGTAGGCRAASGPPREVRRGLLLRRSPRSDGSGAAQELGGCSGPAGQDAPGDTPPTPGPTARLRRLGPTRPSSARLGPAVRVRLGAAGPSAAAPLRLREGCGREADNSGS